MYKYIFIRPNEGDNIWADLHLCWPDAQYLLTVQIWCNFYFKSNSAEDKYYGKLFVCLEGNIILIM